MLVDKKCIVDIFFPAKNIFFPCINPAHRPHRSLCTSSCLFIRSSSRSKLKAWTLTALGKSDEPGYPLVLKSGNLKKKRLVVDVPLFVQAKVEMIKKCQVMWVRVDYRRAFRKIFSGKTHAKSDPEEWSPWRYIWNSQWLGQNWTSGTPVRPISIHSLEAKSTRN